MMCVSISGNTLCLWLLSMGLFLAYLHLPHSNPHLVSSSGCSSLPLRNDVKMPLWIAQRVSRRILCYGKNVDAHLIIVWQSMVHIMTDNWQQQRRRGGGRGRGRRKRQHRRTPINSLCMKASDDTVLILINIRFQCSECVHCTIRTKNALPQPHAKIVGRCFLSLCGHWLIDFLFFAKQ